MTSSATTPPFFGDAGGTQAPGGRGASAVDADDEIGGALDAADAGATLADAAAGGGVFAGSGDG